MLQLNAKVFSEIESPFVFLLACEQEMETLFVNEFSNTSLRVLKAGDEKAISILSTWSSCELDRNHSWYFGCSDSRLSSSSYLDTMMNLFTLTKGDFYFNLKVRNGLCCCCWFFRYHLWGKIPGGTRCSGLYEGLCSKQVPFSAFRYIRQHGCSW